LLFTLNVQGSMESALNSLHTADIIALIPVTCLLYSKEDGNKGKKRK